MWTAKVESWEPYVVAVFTTKTKAQEYVAICNANLNYEDDPLVVGTLPLDPEPPEFTLGVCVFLSADGTVRNIDPIRYNQGDEVDFIAYNDLTKTLYITVPTEDEEKAVSVATRVYAHYFKALGTLPTKDRIKTTVQEELKNLEEAKDG